MRKKKIIFMCTIFLVLALLTFISASRMELTKKNSDLSNSFKILSKNTLNKFERIPVKDLENKIKIEYIKKFEKDKVSNSMIPILRNSEIKKVSIVLLNFQNNPNDEPITKEQAEDAVFNGKESVKAYYEEESFGKIKLKQKGDVYGYYTLPYNDTDCQNGNWVKTAEKMIANDGLNIEKEDYIIYFFASNSKCGGWAGLAGGHYLNNSEDIYHFSLIRWWDKALIAHELGHNLGGVVHSKALNCFNEFGQRVSISNNCSEIEYGDIYDVMGIGAKGILRHMNGRKKEEMGFLKDSNIKEVNKEGIYEIFPLEEETNKLQVLKIPVEMDGIQSTSEYYYIEYRKRYGFDDFERGDYAERGPLIRYVKEVRRNESYLLDMTPETDSFYDSSLEKDKVFKDNYISIKTLDVNPGISTKVYIDFLDKSEYLKKL